ncbi:hypothetical protein XPN_1535, partial [Xanthomonas arboricola pv. pruni MAFF 301427]
TAPRTAAADLPARPAGTAGSRPGRAHPGRAARQRTQHALAAPALRRADLCAGIAQGAGSGAAGAAAAAARHRQRDARHHEPAWPGGAGDRSGHASGLGTDRHGPADACGGAGRKRRNHGPARVGGGRRHQPDRSADRAAGQRPPVPHFQQPVPRRRAAGPSTDDPARCQPTAAL